MKKKVYLYAIIFLAIDLITKAFIVKSGNIMFNQEVIPNFFSLTFVKNTGAAFSFLTGYSWIFVIIAIAVLLYIDRAFLKDNLRKLQIISYSMLIGGIFGNLVNRLFDGYVVDFLAFKIFGYDFPVFNFADVFIIIAAGLIIIDLIRSEVNENRSKKRK